MSVIGVRLDLPQILILILTEEATGPTQGDGSQELPRRDSAEAVDSFSKEGRYAPGGARQRRAEERTWGGGASGGARAPNGTESRGQANGEGLDRLAAEPRSPPRIPRHQAPEPWRKWAEAETPPGGPAGLAWQVGGHCQVTAMEQRGIGGELSNSGLTI
jgi:hypothetical protein